jgi:hypothetical protein
MNNYQKKAHNIKSLHQSHGKINNYRPSWRFESPVPWWVWTEATASAGVEVACLYESPGWRGNFLFFSKKDNEKWMILFQLNETTKTLGWSGGSKVTDFYDITIPSTPASEWNRLPSWRNPSHFHFQGSWNPSPFSYFGIFLFFLKLTITPTPTKKSIDKLWVCILCSLDRNQICRSPSSLTQKSQ